MNFPVLTVAPKQGHAGIYLAETDNEAINIIERAHTRRANSPGGG